MTFETFLVNVLGSSDEMRRRANVLGIRITDDSCLPLWEAWCITAKDIALEQIFGKFDGIGKSTALIMYYDGLAKINKDINGLYAQYWRQDVEDITRLTLAWFAENKKIIPTEAFHA